MSFRYLGVQLGNHGERQRIPRLRRRHGDGRKTLVDRRFCRRHESNITKLDSGDRESFQHCRLQEGSHFNNLARELLQSLFL